MLRELRSSSSGCLTETCTFIFPALNIPILVDVVPGLMIKMVLSALIRSPLPCELRRCPDYASWLSPSRFHWAAFRYPSGMAATLPVPVQQRSRFRPLLLPHAHP